MPFYEYRCLSCDEKFEHYAKNTSDEAKMCPKCSSSSIKKLLSMFGFKSGSSSGGDLVSSAGSSSCAACSSDSCSSCSGA